MSAKAISEFDGKNLIATGLESFLSLSPIKAVKISLIDGGTLDSQFDLAMVNCPWIQDIKLVAKPDQLIKRRGKTGLILLNSDWDQVKHWIRNIAGTSLTTGNVTGKIDTFIVEPFLVHDQSEEYYFCIRSVADGDEILFARQGGINVGDVDELACRVLVQPLESLNEDVLKTSLKSTFIHLNEDHFHNLFSFIISLYNVFVDYHFTYLEINPLVQTKDGQLHMLDLAAKLDQTAEYLCARLWNKIAFPSPFGREATPEETYIAELDAKTGASLKLTILNKEGRIWTMVAGGGASVAFSDAIASHGFAHELANYGEYSGAPSEAQTYEYAKTILTLMTRGDPRPDGKILFIGGGIANFTNVAATFKGIIRAIEEYNHDLTRQKVKIYVRRAGPNYLEGLTLMKELGDRLNIPIHVYGPEMHITGIVPLALKGDDTTHSDAVSMTFSNSSATELFNRCFTPIQNVDRTPNASPLKSSPATPSLNMSVSVLTLEDEPIGSVMNRETRALVWGMYSSLKIIFIYSLS